MPLVINSLGADTQTDTQIYVLTHNPKQFQETGACGQSPLMPGLKIAANYMIK